MNIRKLGLAALAGVGAIALNVVTGSVSHAAACPAITQADTMGIAPGTYPGIYDLSEFEKIANCTMSFSENPSIKELNARIKGNPALPPVSERLPKEPLVVVPYTKIGKYGGTFRMISNAPEAGTSDFLSVRHVNLVRYSDDLQTIVPNIAKSWDWNDDYTKLTFHLRKGHKWSDGEPFTSADVKFWYDNLALDPNVIAKPKDYVLVAGKRMTIDTPDPETVVFNLPSPKPGLLAHFAFSYAQAIQPMHFLGKFHPAINPDADKYAKSLGFKDGYDAIKAYYGNSDWTDTSTPGLNHPDLVATLPKVTMPTLESHILVQQTTESRHFVANPYFHMVDTAGHQLPYIDEEDETYVNENEVRLLKLVNGEVDYKAQSLQLAAAPMLLDGQDKGKYKIDLKPMIAEHVISFNLTDENLEKRKVFDDLRFREAMSIAINRDEINDVAFFGQGTPQQYIGFSPAPAFVDPKWQQYMIKFDPDKAKKLLDEAGVVDKDGDGFRDLPNGDRFVLNLQYSTQGIAGQVVELVGQDWTNVGVKTTVKEVTPDEYRSAQSSNKLDIGAWEMGKPLPIVLGLNQSFVPPFGDYFDHRTGMLWGEWLESNGSSGVEPPDWAKKMVKDINTFQSATVGSDLSNKTGEALVENLTKHLVMIGLVHSPSPIYHTNRVKNFATFKTASYEFYRTYPYLPAQWYIDE